MHGFTKDKEGYLIFKDPNASKEYSIDYSRWLVDGDTIISCNWTVPDGINKADEGIFPGDTKVWVKLSGGTLNKNYCITAHIVTAQGREDDQSFRVVIRNN
jgi:hypothetical protein